MHEQFDGLMRLLIDEGYECIMPKKHPEWWRETIGWARKFDIPMEKIIQMYTVIK